MGWVTQLVVGVDVRDLKLELGFGGEQRRGVEWNGMKV